jgi:hypothetical protein
MSNHFKEHFSSENKAKVDKICVGVKSLNGFNIKEDHRPYAQPGLGFMFCDPLNEDTNKQIEFLESLTSSYIIGATSGAGKSHLLYQFAKDRYSFFLQCTLPEDAKPCSGAMFEVVENLIRIIPKYSPDDRLDIVKYKMTRLIHIYSTALDVARENDWTPFEFLIAQLIPKKVFGVDVFLKAWNDYETFPEATKKFEIQEVFILLDEAQFLQKNLKAQFISGTASSRGSTGERNLFYGVLKALQGTKVVFSGTGISMLDALKSQSSDKTVQARAKMTLLHWYGIP